MMKVVDVTTASVHYLDQEFKLDIVVIQGGAPTLLGRNWLSHLVLNCHNILHTSLTTRVDLLLDIHSKVFNNTLGTMSQHYPKLHLKPNTSPKFWYTHSVPFALKNRIEKELDNHQLAGIIEPIVFSEWAASIVAVPKKDGLVHICGDYKVDHCPLTKPKKLFASVTGDKKFTKIDLCQVYQQIFLDNQSEDLVTINTHNGLYRYTII